MNYPKLDNATSSWGAAMGRPDTIEDADEALKMHLYKMPMVDGDYDKYGAYWGAGDSKTGYMYHAYCDEPKNELFLRAKNREHAKAEVREVLANASFYR